MGGQTIRLMEEFLRNGNKEEIAYAHGGEISPLFTGTLDGSAKLNNMTSMNQILHTTYTGVSSHTGPLGYENPDLGYIFLMDTTSRIIGHDARVHTTYTGVSSHTGPLGYENPDLGTFFLMDTTSRIIGHDAREEWRKMMVSYQ